MSDTHREAMRLAGEAELLALAGREEAARTKLEQAAELEELAASAVPESRPRTRGILRVSAVSLWLQAGRPGRAADLAEVYLGEPLDSAFARELDELRVSCRRAESLAKRLPEVSDSLRERAGAQELALLEGRIVSTRITDLRAA